MTKKTKTIIEKVSFLFHRKQPLQNSKAINSNTKDHYQYARFETMNIFFKKTNKASRNQIKNLPKKVSFSKHWLQGFFYKIGYKQLSLVQKFYNQRFFLMV